MTVAGDIAFMLTDPTIANVDISTATAAVVGTVNYVGTGNGTCTGVTGGSLAVTETVTVTFSNATTAAVVGSVSGALGTATVGTAFTGTKVNFLLTAGTVPFQSGDRFTIQLTGRVWTATHGIRDEADEVVLQQHGVAGQIGRVVAVLVATGSLTPLAAGTTIVVDSTWYRVHSALVIEDGLLTRILCRT